MKTNFTPGPWHTGGKHDCIIYNKNGQPIASCEHSTHLRLEWQRGNAALIAAAPELLEALETLLARSAQLDQSANHDGINNCDAIAAARTAIAKAKGA